MVQPADQFGEQLVSHGQHDEQRFRQPRGRSCRAVFADSRRLCGMGGVAAGGPGFGTIEVPRASAHRFADGTGYAALTWQLAVSASDFPPLGSSTVTAIVPSDGVRVVVGNQGRPCRTTIRSPS